MSCNNEPHKEVTEPARTRQITEIEVVLSPDAPSGVETWDFDQDLQHVKLPHAWPEELVAILRDNKLVSWQPSFPLQYTWSEHCPKDVALQSYIKADRDRFIRFNFPQGSDIRSIAKKLIALDEIDQAVAVPGIVPPSNQPGGLFTGTSDQIMPICGPTTCLTNQWYLFRTCVPDAWDVPASGNGVVIADIDWGFDLSHPDLARTALRRNIIRKSPNVSDGNLLWHGNGVLGLAGAAVNPNGMAGIAFGATLWAIQASSGGINRPVVNPQFWVEAIDFVRKTAAAGRKVIILELQTDQFGNAEMIPSINKAITDAITEDEIVACVPAGNGNGDAGRSAQNEVIPDTGSIVVGATRYHPELNLRGGSNGGERVVVYAPGDIEADLTCGLGASYRERFGGTSGATAKVAGVVALMLEKNNQLTPEQIRTILRRSQKQVFDEQGTRVVGVLVDAHQAVSDSISLRSTAEDRISAANIERGGDALQAA